VKSHIGLRGGTKFVPEPFIIRPLDAAVVEMKLRRRIPLIDGGSVGDARKLRSEKRIGRDAFQRKEAGKAKLRRPQLVFIFRIVIGQLDTVPRLTGKNRAIRLNQENILLVELLHARRQKRTERWC